MTRQYFVIETFLAILAIEVILCSAFSCNVSFDPETDYCQPWAHWNPGTEKCECSDKMLLQVNCYTSYSVLRENSCLYYDNQSHVTLLASCPYNSHREMVRKVIYVPLPNESLDLNSYMCDPLNRTGLFCSHCKEGLGPAMLNYSHPCLECTKYGWAIYFTATVLPTTLFCMVFIAFHIDISSPAFSYVILHCQIITGYFHQQPGSLFARYKYARMLFVTLIGFWNLDFFRELIPSFCVSSTMSTNTVVALEYTTALYPFLLIAVTYGVIELHARGCRPIVFLWKPLHPHCVRLRKSWNLRGSVINAFTTFLCLSYSKILSTSFILLYQVPIDGNCKILDAGGKRSYLNASIASKVNSVPYFYAAIIIPAIFCVLPIVVLVFHHTRPCRRCLGKVRIGQLVHEMAKIFEQHFKDGTGNSRDCRWMSGLYFFIRIITVTSTLAGHGFYLIIALYVMFISTLLFAIVHPYKENRYNNLDTLWFATLTIVIFCGWYQIYYKDSLIVTLHILIGLSFPLLYFILLLLYRLVSKVFRCCRGKGWLKCCCIKGELTVLNSHEELPDRLVNSSEYTSLLPTEHTCRNS